MIRGTMPYYFIDDNNATAGMVRLRDTYPNLGIVLALEPGEFGSSIMVEGNWHDVLELVRNEYEGSDAEPMVDILRSLEVIDP